jgi:hypothetical protein
MNLVIKACKWVIKVAKMKKCCNKLLRANGDIHIFAGVMYLDAGVKPAHIHDGAPLRRVLYSTIPPGERRDNQLLTERLKWQQESVAVRPVPARVQSAAVKAVLVRRPHVVVVKVVQSAVVRPDAKVDVRPVVKRPLVKVA